ncbi:MAG: LolA family protein [Alphaproteobacteria bacterium]
MISKYLIVFLLSLCTVSQAKEKILLKNIENYLNSVKSLDASFLQSVETKNDCGVGKGKLQFKCYEDGNKKIRIDYEKGQTLIAKDGELIFYDAHDKTPSIYELNDTPLSIIFRPLITFDKDVAIRYVDLKGEQISVCFARLSDPPGVSLTLVFSFDTTTNNIKSLISWSVVDLNGDETGISLDQKTLKTNIKINDKVFIIPFQKD